MRRAGEYPKLSEHLGREAVLWQHALDGLHHDKFGLLEPHVSELAVFLTTDVTREGHILSRFFFFAGEDNLARVNDDNEISGVDVGRVSGLVTAAQDIGGFNGETAEHFPLSIDQMPLGGLQRLILGQIGFHLRKGAKGKDFAIGCQPRTLHIFRNYWWNRLTPQKSRFTPQLIHKLC